MPEPQRRLTVAPPTDSGKPASSAAMRATLRLSSPAWLAQPSTHVLDVLRRHAGALEQRAQRVGREVVGADGREPAAVAAERRPHRVDDQRVGHPSSSA